MRIPGQNIPNGSMNYNGYPQMNGLNGYNPNSVNSMNLVSPKAGTVYSQPPPNNNVLNRTFQSNYDQISSPTIVDKNLIAKKSPYKFQEQRNTVDFRSSSNFSTASNPPSQNTSGFTQTIRTNSDIIEPSNYFPSQPNVSTNSEIQRGSYQGPSNMETSGTKSDPKYDRLALTRTQILVKNHLKCIQINQLAL